MSLLDAVKFNADGLVAAIVQDRFSGAVLMQAWMNAEALQITLDERVATFWSRSRSEIWVKGATSGNTQKVVDVRLDCDGDALLLMVEPAGPACHTGEFSCFYRQAAEGAWQDAGLPDAGILSALSQILEARKSAAPDSSYVASLYAKGRDKILQKLGEEAIETVIAGKSDQTAELIYEMADLWFHSLVLLADAGLQPADILQELDRRMGVSGLAEKAARAAGEK